MRRRITAKRLNRQKSRLGLPDLDHVKSAVLVSLRSPESQRSYRRSIDDFVCWYCSEPRLSFSKTVVTRYRIHLEERLLAPGTINVRLAAVRRETEALGARRKECQETGGGSGSTEVGGTAASDVGEWRGVRTVAQ